MEGDAPASLPQPPIHLVVLQHGLWGNTTCVSNLEKYLRQHLGPKGPNHSSAHADAGATDHTGANAAAPAAGAIDAAGQQEAEVQILNSDVNRKALTYDGIDVCGARVVKMILDCIQLLQSEGRQVTKLSFVGYSLGGLILRYAVGKLYVLGLFEEVECANFITIATPHLGSWRSPTSFWARFFNSHVAVVGSWTGRQLMLADADYSVPWLTQQQQLHEQAHAQHTAHTTPSKPHAPQQQPPQQQDRQQQAEFPPGVKSGQAVPLLLLMAHPAGPFYKALSGFKTRMVAANILYDAMVPYCTASLCMTNPYEERLAVSIDADRYPSVVRPAAVGEEVTHKLTYKGRTKRLFLFALFSPLAPLLYIWTVTYGLLHHRSARKKALEGSWLQQHSAAALASTLRPSLSSRSSGSKSAQQQQPLLLQGGTRTAASLSTAGGAAAVADGAGSSDGLISTAVEPAGQGCGQEDGPETLDHHLHSGIDLESNRSPLEQAMQKVATATADADAPSALDKTVDTATGTAAGAADAAGVGGSVGMSRQKSDNLAAIVAHHQREDELGRLNRQLSSKGSVKLGLKGPAAADDADAADGADAESAAAAAAAAERVTVDRDGIVEAPSLLHVQQQWMAQQLFDKVPPCRVPDNNRQYACSSSEPAATAAAAGSSDGVAKVTKQGRTDDKQQQQGKIVEGQLSSGGWHRVDVCTRHWHAHAAIIIRDYRFEGQSKDMFQYLVDHMSL